MRTTSGINYNGIIPNHAYQIIEVMPDFPLMTGERVDLLRLRSPWPRGEWTGDWSCRSAVWDLVEPGVRRAVGLESLLYVSDGSFFMLMSDFLAVFDKIYLCKALADGYRSSSVRGVWAPGTTSGGSADCPTWSMNPQFQVIVDRPTNAFITLSQSDVRRPYSPDAALLPVGFSVFKHCVSGKRIMFSEGVPPHGELKQRIVFSEMRDRVWHTQLDPSEGPYVIVPALYRPEMESGFTLEILVQEGVNATIKPVEEWPNAMIFTGRWTDRMSGGCTNHSTWRSNPSYTICSDAPPGVPNQVTFVLSSDAAQKDFSSAPSVGLYLLRNQEVVEHCKNFAQHIVHVVTLPPNVPGMSQPFNVLLSTFRPGIKVGYVLTASSDQPFKMI